MQTVLDWMFQENAWNDGVVICVIMIVVGAGCLWFNSFFENRK